MAKISYQARYIKHHVPEGVLGNIGWVAVEREKGKGEKQGGFQPLDSVRNAGMGFTAGRIKFFVQLNVHGQK